MRRDAYHASPPATTSPPSSDTAKNFISVSHVSRRTVFGFATTSAPNVVPASSTGNPTAMYGRVPSGGVNSKVTESPPRILGQSTSPDGSLRRPGASPGKSGRPA